MPLSVSWWRAAYGPLRVAVVTLSLVAGFIVPRHVPPHAPVAVPHLAADAPGPALTDTPTASPTDTPTPSSTATPTYTPSPTPTATQTPTPTQTPTVPSYVPPVGIPVATSYPTLPPPVPTKAGAPDPPSRGYQVGAYYFSGWSHGQNDNLSPLLTAGPLRRYEPLIGWYDDSQRQVDKNIVQAAGAGLSFFAFDWYDLALSPYATDRTLNNGLRYYLTSRQRSRLGFCIMFVDQAPFVPRARDWPGLVQKWLRYFRQPDYVRVNGKPLFIIFSPEIMRQIFGSPANVHLALDYLRLQVRRHGLPGITIAVAATVAPNGNPLNYGRLVPEGYDVTTGYNYHDVAGAQPNRPLPYRQLVQNNQQMWQRVATHLPQRYIPVVTTGWDQRFSVREQRRAFLYAGRTPHALLCYMAAARHWVDTHPKRTVRERIVLLFAWNEIGEGGALIPNRTEGYAYTNTVRRVFGAPGHAPGPLPCR